MKTNQTILPLFLLFLTVPSVCVAESMLVYPNATERPIDTRATAAIVPVDDDLSYCCSIWPESPDSPAGLYVDVARLSETSAIQSHREQQGFEFPRVASPASISSPGEDLRRVCFTTGYSGESVRIEIRNPAADSGTIRCEQTALSGGFNTFASDHVFLEILAQGHGESPVFIKGYYANGGELAFEKEVDVESRLDLSITELVGRQKIGRVVITHLGGPGSLQAFIAEYRNDPMNPVTGFSLTDRKEFSVVGGK